MNKLCLLLLVGLAACSVKKKPETPAAQAAPAVDVGGVKVSEGKKFFLRPSIIEAKQFKAHEENTVSYRLVDAELLPLDLREYEIHVEYNMPHHPSMGGPWFPLVKRLDNSRFETTYDISMGGDWLFIFTIKRAGSVVDVIRFWVRDIPE